MSKTIYQNKSKSFSVYKSDEFGYYVICGFECGNACYCKNRKQCKYGRPHYRWHNIKVRIRDFFKYKLHINLPYFPISFLKHWTLLSGTKRCPFKMPEKTECCNCKNCHGTDENYHLTCSLKQRPAFYDDPCWKRQCSNYLPHEPIE